MILRALFFRPIMRRPWRLVVTVIGVAAGIAAVVSTVAASRAAIASFAEGVEEVAGAARLEVTRPGGLPEELLGELCPLAGDALIVPVVEESVLMVELEDGVRLLGVDVLLDGQVRPVLEGDDGPPDLEQFLLGFGALISGQLAERLAVAPGDRLTVSADGRPRSIEVTALFEADGLSAVWERVVVMDVAAAQELLGRVGRLDRIELVPRAGVDIDRLRARAMELIPPGTVVDEPSQRRRFAEQMLASLRFNLVALSAISLLVGGVLVATTLATSVVQRRYVVALLRSLGASRRQVATAVVGEALAIGALGGLLGVAAGFGGARLALASVRFTVASVVRGIPQGLRPVPPRRLPTRTRITVAAALVAIGLAAAMLTRAPALWDLPVAALLAALLVMSAILVGSGALLDSLARIGHLPLARARLVAVQLASAALSAGRRRAAWAAGSVGVAVALAIAIATMVSSFRSTVESWTESGLRADVWVRPLAAATGVWVGRLDPEIVTIAEELFGPEAVDPFYSQTISYRGRPVSFAGAAFDVVQHFGSVPFPGRESAAVFAEALERGGAVVNEPFANRFSISEGDRLRIELPGGVLEPEVVGVFRDYSRSHGLVVVDRKHFLRFFPNRGPDDMALFLPPATDAAAARQRMLDALQGRFLVEALLNRQLKGAVLDAFERTFAITTAMYLVAAVVAVVAVAAVLFTLVGERRRELATVRTLGGSRLQLMSMVVAEAGLLGMAAAGAGAVAGLAVGVILVKVVNLQSFGWSLELVLPWRSLIEMAVWVVSACLIAGLPPAVIASRLQPATVLREEG
jgi:putative ABC transport system permease protein